MPFQKMKQKAYEMLAKAKKTVIEAKDKALAALGLGAAGLAPSDSMAAVAFDGPTQTFSGTFDLTAYYSSITILIVAISVVAAISLAIRSFKRV